MPESSSRPPARSAGPARARARRRNPLLILVALVALLGTAVACSSAGEAPHEADPVARITLVPGAGATQVGPKDPLSAHVAQGSFDAVTLTNTASGTVVNGTLSGDRTTYTASEPLGYGQTYAWTGSATGTDGRQVPVEGSFSTVSPDRTVHATFMIADGDTVGVAAPIIVQFDEPVADKAAAERNMIVTTDPPTVGSWAWLPDDNGGARAHWRPQNYWVPGTTVHVASNLYGVPLGSANGADIEYGSEDATLDFTIGRSQIVKADASSHRMVVERDGVVVMDVPVSYGQGNEDRNVTRSGTHVVSEKHEDFLMSNPPYYENVRERWAVRISNNGEFIHANPETTGQQGATNVTNGCINLSTADAQEYFGTALYGDPVEVTNTRIDMSAADGDIYDWIIDWPQWQAMSALAPNSTVGN